MKEKYIVRLSAEEREELKSITKKLSGSSQKVRRANILLKADADGPNWIDAQIAEAFSCRIRTIEKLRKRLVTRGFQEALNGKQREEPPRKKKLDGRQEAKLIALALGGPPKGYSSWSLRLLAREAVELDIVESISHETVRQTLKKTDSQPRRSSTGGSLQKTTRSLSPTWKRFSKLTSSPIIQAFPWFAWMNNQPS